MGVEAYWIRLDVDYDRVWWLRHEPRFVKDAFPNLIRHIRRESPRKGTIKFRDAEDLADILRYSKEEAWAFYRMLECAQMTCESDDTPAIVIENGTLTVVKWGEFQGYDAVRKRKERQELDNNSGHNELSPDILDKSGTNEISPDTPVTRDTGTREHGNTNSIDKSIENTKRAKRIPLGCDPNLLFDYLPPSMKTSEGVNAWTEYIEYRHQQKQTPYVEKGLKAIASNFIKGQVTAEGFRRILNHCMSQGWKGIPPDVVLNWNTRNNRQQPTQQKTTIPITAELLENIRR